MSLTVGTAPFGQRPGGEFNFELPRRKGLIYFEDSPRRIRARLGGETVVDSRHAKLLHEHGLLPVYYFPADEVRTDLLAATAKRTTCPWKGEASYWSVHAGGKVAEDAVWSYPEPVEGAPPIAGYLAFYWNAMDEWLEEDEPIYTHPRSPYARIDVLASSRHVRVSLDGVVLAESRQPRILYETYLRPRFYLPMTDANLELLRPSDLQTHCPYKGTATYWDVVLPDGAVHEGIVWTYRTPLPESQKIAGLLAFYDERLDVDVDGVRQPR